MMENYSMLCKLFITLRLNCMLFFNYFTRIQSKHFPTSEAKYFAMDASLVNGSPAARRLAALYTMRRAACICVPM